ncbi:MAG: vitamin B12-dependent ribonucleotide reductase [Patescibacteria group bacterium]|nr:vitamin B12-dependent ribonucleotide reductase [Patescibacteria group bacterium]MDD5490419.1 vitamin B12-dependent ribonucleotide reductase [Patescibacteria group bacterium]
MTKEELLSKKPEFSPSALEVIKKRYLRQDENGEPIETPEEMFYRVAAFIASADKNYAGENSERSIEQFYEILVNLEFLPGGRVLFEAGNNHTGQMSSCFVIPVEDSMEAIFDSLKAAALVQQNNGGTGFNFSRIRPKGDTVKGVPGIAAGPVHYLRTYDTALSRVLQGSKRHGANMGILNVTHPDIEEFIELKDNGSTIKNFNISVGVTNGFMERVRNDEEYELINPRTGKTVKNLRARDIFNKITKRAWECADPGIIFLDRMEEGNNNPHLGKIEATNPCGEQPLLPYESCNLGSVVLPNHSANGDVDWIKMERTIRRAVHFMDNMIDLNKFPLPVIRENVSKTRKIGLGAMGFAQLLFKLGIPYNSEESVALIEKIMKFIYEIAKDESIKMAETRGVFPAWRGSKWEKMGIKIRNSHLTSIAPNGTISLVASTSSGIEPVFSLATVRRMFYEDNSDGGGRVVNIIDPVFERVAKERGFYSDKLLEKIAEEGTLKDIPEIPADVKKIFTTAHDVTFDWHIKIQAAAQKYTDAAVSKTINFPRYASVDDVRRAYILAYELGCKGVTIYRDGSKEFQVLNLKEKAEVEEAKPEPVPTNDDCIELEPVSKKAVEEIHVPTKIPLTPNALTVLEKRALIKNKDGQVIETPEELFRRVSKWVASAEKTYGATPEEIFNLEEKFYEIQSQLRFLSGQALRNSGHGRYTLSACFVLPIYDSIESITDAIKENVIIHKSTGGTGFNYSRLRAKGSQVGEAGPVAAGPVTFMKAVNLTQGTIQTKGGRQQGSMAILNVNHPDIEEFIKVKDEQGELEHMNISVGITKEFMEAVKEDKDFNLTNPADGRTVKTVRAKKIFDSIVEHAWRSGDPGLILLDRIEEDNPTPTLGKLDTTNPCGEQPLLPYETCNLGSIILSNHITDEGLIDWEKLRETVRYAVHFLDNTIDINVFPLKKIEEATRANRKIGLGVMGFADMLIKLGIPYNSDEAVAKAEEIMSFINKEAHGYSEELGSKKGSFPNFDISSWKNKKGYLAMRNATVTTIAPTGYTSIVASCSSGIEPVFALAFKRQNSMGGVDQFEVHSLFEEVAKKRGFYSESLMERIMEEGGVKNLKEVPEDIKKVFVCAHDISPEWDLRIQAAFQKYTDNAVSKTINFPANAATEDIARVYLLAYEKGCKGITIYRDGSRSQVLTTGKKGEPKEERGISISNVSVPGFSPAPRPRPECVQGFTYKIKTGYGTLFVTVNNDEEGKPFEVFANIGKTGGFFSAKSESICRLISLALRSQIDVKIVIEQLKGIRGPMPSWSNGKMILSIPDAISQVLEEHVSKSQQKLDLKFSQESKEKTPMADYSVEDKIEEVKESIRENIKTTEEKKEMASESPSEPLNQATLVKETKETVIIESEPITPVTLHGSGHGIVAQTEVKTKTRVAIADFGVAPQCPDCGNILELGEGCMMCRVCGYSKCG